MNRKEMLLNVLDKTYDKESWFAPLKDSIEGITAGQASWKPSGDATKSIWENVNHLLYYKERIVANLEGREWTQNLDGDQTFSFTEQSNEENEWKKVVERLDNSSCRLRQLLSNMTDEDLKRDSFFELKLMDLLLHDAYHTGQIIQIRKMQGSWPSHR
ncbi:DinB family protein [Bacillus sp. AFS055030]|uniref:DinB family protein n=1 Tax=Bacillus sp. AFS055030 TaxID=2033507 RepID=UPI0011556746|nr:DinB family protein [Bacillus sp. AFS055030]